MYHLKPSEKVHNIRGQDNVEQFDRRISNATILSFRLYHVEQELTVEPQFNTEHKGREKLKFG